MYLSIFYPFFSAMQVMIMIIKNIDFNFLKFKALRVLLKSLFTKLIILKGDVLEM